MCFFIYTVFGRLISMLFTRSDDPCADIAMFPYRCAMTLEGPKRTQRNGTQRKLLPEGEPPKPPNLKKLSHVCAPFCLKTRENEGTQRKTVFQNYCTKANCRTPLNSRISLCLCAFSLSEFYSIASRIPPGPGM